MSLHTELVTLVAVADSASFAAAARRLSLSPAMVGRRIQALEARYGAKLIERTTRSHRLTPVGQRVVEKAGEIVRAVEELDELARVDSRELSGRVRMSAPTTLGIRRIAAAVAAMSAEHPDLVIELSLGDERRSIWSRAGSIWPCASASCRPRLSSPGGSDATASSAAPRPGTSRARGRRRRLTTSAGRDAS